MLFLGLSHISFAFYFILLGNRYDNFPSKKQISGENPHILAIMSLTALAAYLHVLIFLLLADMVHGISYQLLKRGYCTSANR